MKMYSETLEGRIFNFLTSWWALIPVLLLLLVLLCFLIYVIVIHTINIQAHRLPKLQEQQQQQQPYLTETISAIAYAVPETWHASHVPPFVPADNLPVRAKDYLQLGDLSKRHANFFSRPSRIQKLNHPFSFLQEGEIGKKLSGYDFGFLEGPPFSLRQSIPCSSSCF
jgi:hypothetical protein